jgi:hypothetical protein
MNKKWLPHGITAGALVFFIVLGLACASTPEHKWAGVRYNGEDSPMLEGTTWTYIGHNDGTRKIAEFRSGGKLVMPGAGNCIWMRSSIDNTHVVRFTTDDGWARYEGRYYPETKKIMGSAENSRGVKWDFTLELNEGSSPQIGASSGSGASQSTTRTVPVTVYYEMNGTRLSAVYTVTASSGNEAEEQGRRLWQNQFGFNAQAKFISATAAWY